MVELEYLYGKSVHLLRLFTNQAICRCLYMSGTANQPDHMPSTGRSNNRTAQYLGNTAGEVGLPIWAFPGRFLRIWRREAERCHALESLFRASAHIVTVFRAVFEGCWLSFTRTVFNIEITVFEVMEPITARCFT